MNTTIRSDQKQKMRDYTTQLKEKKKKKKKKKKQWSSTEMCMNWTVGYNNYIF